MSIMSHQGTNFAFTAETVPAVQPPPTDGKWGGWTAVVLTWVSANELWPRALLGRRGVRGADQLVLGHLGVGLGKLQPQGLRDLWVEPDPLVAERYFRLLGVN